MILGQKANLSDYSSSKWVVKQWRQLATSTMHLTQELLMNIQCSDGSRSFAKETTALKMSSVTGHHSWQWPTERIVKADPLRTTEEVAQELNVKHSIVVWHWKQTGKVITLHKWVPHELTENKKKNLSFWSVFFSYSTHPPTIFQTDCDLWWKVNFIWYQQWPAQWLE